MRRKVMSSIGRFPFALREIYQKCLGIIGLFMQYRVEKYEKFIEEMKINFHGKYKDISCKNEIFG